jgi:predicted GIY-YIG superfamily endonuclease
MNDFLKILIDIPNSPGVYIIWHENRAYYVGMAKDLRKRLTTHDRLYEFKRLQGNVRVEIRQCSLQLIRSEEKSLIRELQPRANGYPIGSCVADPVRSAERMNEFFELFDWLFIDGPTPGRLR